MTYTGHCPHCNQVVRAGHGGPAKRIGSPIMTCPYCKKIYLDENMYEWAVIASECKLRYYLIDNNRWFYGPFLSILVGSAAESFLFGIIVLVMCLLFYWLFVKYANDGAIQESIKRCSNISYVDTLVEVQYEKLDQRFSDDYHARHKKVVCSPSKDPTPSSTAKSGDVDDPVHQSHRKNSHHMDAAPSESFSDNASQKICHFIWLGVKLFVSHIDSNLILHSHAYLWAAYLYVLAKTLRSQAIINQIYSYFPIEAKSYLGERYRGIEPMMIITSSYKNFAVVLNGSRIDPRTDSGMQALWHIVSRWVFGNNPVPADAEKHFLSNCKMVLSVACASVKQDKEVSAAEKYSISEPCTLPE